MWFRIAVNVIVDPSDQNVIYLVGQMDFVIPVHREGGRSLKKTLSEKRS